MAIYPSINGYPDLTSIDMSINQHFRVNVSGSVVTHYQLFVYDTTVIPNTLKYNSTKLALSPNLSNGAELSHLITGGTISNNSKYKWYVQTWSGTDSATSRQFTFNAYTSPTISMTVPTTVTSQSLSLTGVYSQAQGIYVNSYAFELYDENNNLLKTTGDIYGFDLSYTFTGLDSHVTYGVRLHGLNQVGMEFDTGIIQFDVSYTKQQLIINPVAELDESTSNVNLYWGDVVQINGTATGTYSYQTGFYDGGKLLKINSGSSIEWDYTIPEAFTSMFLLRLQNGFEGVIKEFKDDLKFGYENGSFYLEKGARYTYPPQEIYGYIMYVVITPVSITIRAYEDFNVWGNYLGQTWANVLAKGTWNDVLKG